MRFTTREDIGVPAEEVFAVLSDFARFERAALQRGAEVLSEPPPEGALRAWRVKFRYRGRRRELSTVLTENRAPRRLAFEGRLGGLDGRLALDLIALSPKRTRLAVDFEMKPRTLPARLLIQSLRLAKASLSARFAARVRRFREEMESGTVR